MANRAFIRFRNITIPNHSEVSNVYTRFTAYSNRSDTPVNLRCAFVNADNPDAPTSYAELQVYNLTNWVSWGTLSSWTDGQVYDTPDLTDILQTIIERSGWSSGNSVILIIEEDSGCIGQRGFSSFQHNNSTEKSVLFVSYLAREGGTDQTLYEDTFDGDGGILLDTSMWCNQNHVGTLTTTGIWSDKVEAHVVLPDNALINSQFVLLGNAMGDFSVQLDFSDFVTTEFLTGANLYINLRVLEVDDSTSSSVNQQWVIQRIYSSQGEYYFYSSGDNSFPDYPGGYMTSDNEESGSLRLVRNGTDVEAFYFANNIWVSMGIITSYFLKERAKIDISLYYFAGSGNDPLEGKRISFDNFQIVYGHIVRNDFYATLDCLQS